MKVAAVGAGVGGLAVARGLLRDGHEVTVLEKAPEPRLGGAAVSVWFNGAAALAHLGVSLDGVGQRIDRLELRRPEGRLLATFDAAALAERFGVQALTLPRASLLERLAAGIPSGTVHYGTRCIAAYQNGSTAKVELDDGATVEADLIVGADGWRSVVRTALGDATPVRPVGIAAWQILLSMPAPWSSGHRFQYLVSRDPGPGRRAGFMPAGQGLLQAWFDTAWRDGRERPTSILSELRRSFAGWPSPTPEVLEAASEPDFELWRYVSRPVPRVLGLDRLAIIGDAAHTRPPYLAQGANQALEDAWVLADQLRRAGDVTQAVQSYTRLRRRKVAMVSRLATSRLTVGPLRWVERVTPPSGPPMALSTAFYTYFFRAISSALGSR